MMVLMNRYLLLLAVVLQPSSVGARTGFDGYPDQLRFWVHEKHVDEHFETVSFAGLNTFAKIPFENCFNDDNINNRYDIAILGAPHDTVSGICITVHYPC
jgi:hypothetical protein